MLASLQTTAAILVWCFLLSVFWVIANYAVIAKRRKPLWMVKKGESDDRVNALALEATLIVPALVIGPLVLVLTFRFFDLNLLFPVHLFASVWQVIGAAFMPALVLVVASGLSHMLRLQVAREYIFWGRKPFVTASLAYGKGFNEQVRFLVVLKALSSGWSHCLPWLFGELIVVEAVFNAPGLGFNAWEAAKVRDMGALGELLLWTVALYLFCNALSLGLSRWLGQRLEGYL